MTDFNDDNDSYKFYFQIDTDWINKYIDQIIHNLKDFEPISLPVNSWNSSTDDLKKSLYLGNNYYKEQIWKTKYFIKNKIEIEYKNHIKNNSIHIINQPQYYKGMFDILN